MHGRSHAESREIVEQKAKGRVRFSQLQCWFRRFREGPRLCPDSVDAPPPNNQTSKPVGPRDQLLQPASHQREAYQLPAISAGVAYGSPGGLANVAVSPQFDNDSSNSFSVVIEDAKRDI